MDEAIKLFQEWLTSQILVVSTYRDEAIKYNFRFEHIVLNKRYSDLFDTRFHLESFLNKIGRNDLCVLEAFKKK